MLRCTSSTSSAGAGSSLRQLAIRFSQGRGGVLAELAHCDLHQVNGSRVANRGLGPEIDGRRSSRTYSPEDGSRDVEKAHAFGRHRDTHACCYQADDGDPLRSFERNIWLKAARRADSQRALECQSRYARREEDKRLILQCACRDRATSLRETMRLRKNCHEGFF